MMQESITTIYLLFLLILYSTVSFSSENNLVNDAIADGDIQKVFDLVNKGLDVNKTQDNWPPLVFAASYEKKQIVDLLISKGAKINARNGNGDTALILAAYNGHDEIVSLLLKYDAETDTAGGDGATALIWSVKNGHKSVVEILLSNQANPNISIRPHWISPSDQTSLGINGATALMFAAQGDNPDILKMLLDAGADVNQTDSYCNAPLHYAIDEKKTSQVNILRQHGAKDNPICISYQIKQLLLAIVVITILVVVGRKIVAKNLPRTVMVKYITGLSLNFIWAALISYLFLGNNLFHPTSDTLIYYAFLLVPFITITAFLMSEYLIYSRFVIGINFVTVLVLLTNSIRLCSGEYHPIAIALLESIFFSAILIFPGINIFILLNQTRTTQHELKGPGSH